MGLMWLGYLTWLLPVLFVLAISALNIWTCVTKPNRWRGEPACERCGYTITGLESLACPECGTDLRRTGIITPAMELRRRGSLAKAIIGWTCSVFLVSFLGFAWWSIAAIGATRMMGAGSNTTTITLTETFTPVSGSLELVRLTTSQTTGAVAMENIELQFVALDGQTSTMSATLAPSGWEFSSPSEIGIDLSTVSDPGPAEIAAVMRAAGIPTDRDSVRAEANEIALLLDEKLSNPITPAPPSNLSFQTLRAQPSSSSISAAAQPPVAAAPNPFVAFYIGAAAAFAIWLGGLFLVVWLRRRLRRMADIYEQTALSKLAVSPDRHRPRTS
ncbi:MAG: hypothetical protein ACKVZJ_04475 [Phycisphaerales bacterium]